MAIIVNVGGAFFDRMREDGRYYIDKTKLLYDRAQTGNTVTLFIRPRRFENPPW